MNKDELREEKYWFDAFMDEVEEAQECQKNDESEHKHRHKRRNLKKQKSRQNNRQSEE